MWKVENLNKKYRNKSAIHDISFSLEQGQITGLLGVNGAGKSTLIKNMLGLVVADQGISQRDNPDEPVGYLPESPCLPEYASALQITKLSLRLRKQSAHEAETLLEEVQLKREAWSRPTKTYSKGMRQRAALACALAGSPPWLILDEPTSGLDALGRKQLHGLLEQHRNNGAGILMCSHIVPDLVRLCNRIMILADGEIQEEIEIQEHDFSEIDLLESKLLQHQKSRVEA